MLNSPFKKYCNNQDRLSLEENWTLEDFEDLAESVFDKNPNYITDLVRADAIFRAKNHLNHILSIEGEQGQFKSTFGMAFKYYVLCPAYQQDFNFKRIYPDRESLDEAIRIDDFRTIHILDEQRHSNIGRGSVASILSLVDYEEQCRGTQKSIIYISPSMLDHAHYFIFKADETERLNNKNCLPDKNGLCKKRVKVIDCMKNQTSTLCDEFDFNERIGYPKKLIFRIYTHYKYNKNRLVCRGFVALPPPPKEIFKRYFEEIKPLFLSKLEKQEDALANRYTKLIKKVIEESGSGLIIETGTRKVKEVKFRGADGVDKIVELKEDNRRVKPASKSVIEMALFNTEHSARKWTIGQINFLVDNIQFEIEKTCRKLNQNK